MLEGQRCLTKLHRDECYSHFCKDWRQVWEHITFSLLKIRTSFPCSKEHSLFCFGESALQWLGRYTSKGWNQSGSSAMTKIYPPQCMEQLRSCSLHRSLHCAKIWAIFKYAVGKAQPKLNTSLQNYWCLWENMTYRFYALIYDSVFSMA